MEHYLGRADALDGELNAFALRDDDRALADARAATDLVTRSDPADLPPFTGVPIPIKDLNDVAGWPTTHGSFAVPDDPAERDEDVVRRFRDAGFVLMGKTTTPEFGSISFTESRRLGVTRNPWDTEHTPGGSSGGAGAAVASGDGARRPRLRRRRLHSHPGLVLRARGPQAVAEPGDQRRRDLRRRCDVRRRQPNGGRHRGDPRCAGRVRPSGPSTSLRPRRNRSPGRSARRRASLRIRIETTNPVGLPVDPACVTAVERTATLLEGFGHQVDTDSVQWPDPYEFLADFALQWSTGTVYVPLTDPDLLEPHDLADLRAAESTSALDYAGAQRRLQIGSRRSSASSVGRRRVTSTSSSPPRWRSSHRRSVPVGPVWRTTRPRCSGTASRWRCTPRCST